MRKAMLTLALAGDTMLGRGVAERLVHVPPSQLFADEVVALAYEADFFLLNLECAISDRGERWPDPRKPFFFRAPPIATEALTHLGVDCVTLANNHALDFGVTALLDTVGHLNDAGIACVGAGATEVAARTPAILERRGVRVGLIGVTDHPSEYAAGDQKPGVAYVDLSRSVPSWLKETIRDLRADVVVVSPHWGPNMVAEPVPHVRHAAAELRGSGTTLIAGTPPMSFTASPTVCSTTWEVSSTTTRLIVTCATTWVSSSSSRSGTAGRSGSRPSRSPWTIASPASPTATRPRGSRRGCSAPAPISALRSTPEGDDSSWTGRTDDSVLGGFLNAFADEVETLADRLGEAPTLRTRGGAALAGPADAVLVERSPVRDAATRWRPARPRGVRRCDAWLGGVDRRLRGTTRCLHGGFVAAAFDDLMGLAQMASGKAGYTGTLTVRMLKPTPLNRRIDYEAHLEHFEGRKIWCRATAHDGAQLLADAEILFIAARQPYWEG